jgi:hypothetical protein
VCCVPRYLRIATFAALAFVFVQAGRSQASSSSTNRSPSSISLKHVLAPSTPCRTFQRPIQFFSETALLVLSGPPGDCYRSVNQIGLNLISIDGHVIVRKPWPSTDPGVVIGAGRLVLARSADLEVDDKNLTAIQSLEFPPHRFMPMIQRLDQENAVTVTMDGNNYIYGGTPLSLLKHIRIAKRMTQDSPFRSRQETGDGFWCTQTAPSFRSPTRLVYSRTSDCRCSTSNLERNFIARRTLCAQANGAQRSVQMVTDSQPLMARR